MTDALGWRMKFAVVVPSTNTVVQPEYDAMRPLGVSNHISRVTIPDTPVESDEEFLTLMSNIRGATEAAIDSVMSCAPGHLIMGMSAETLWDGLGGANDLQQTLQRRTGIGVTLGSHACQAAIRCYGDVKRIGVITPYMPVGDAQVRRFFAECGLEVVNLLGLRCRSPTMMAQESAARLRRAVREVDDPGIDLIIQLGTNLAFAAVAAEAERWLEKPVLAVNTCTYWHALRSSRIEDRMEGFGSLLLEH